MKESLWLIGAGNMARAYSAVLQAQGIEFRIIGRSNDSAKEFQNITGIEVSVGGLEAALETRQCPEYAILAIDVEQLAPAAMQLVTAGCRYLLLEKPGALSISELKELYSATQIRGAKIWIGYNRRFYSSVQTLKKHIQEDGGITSASFEFTEWSHILQDEQKAPGVMRKWLLANSSHVIDLAFYFIGLPCMHQWYGWHGGSLTWHPAAARFHGAGVSEHGIPFSYQADWEAPGRWGVELLTRRNRYLLRPMEALQYIHIGSVEVQTIELDDSLDREFKPGIFLQCKAFLDERAHFAQKNQLCSLEEQLRSFPIYYRIAGYTEQ